MTENGKFRLGDWLVEPALDRISRGDQRVRLQPQVMDLLVYLARRSREVVSTDELLSQIWRDRVVTKASIYSGLKQLRIALGDDVRDPRYIKTIPKRGYLMIADVDFFDVSHSGDDGAAATVTRTAGLPKWTVAAFLVAVVIAIAAAFNHFQTIAPTKNRAEAAINSTPAIAVLPFAVVGSGQERAWFGDGVAEAILNKLSRIPGLRVSGRASSFAFRDSGGDMYTIGKTLDVSHLLSGSVQNDGEALRLSVRLVRAEDGDLVWAQAYDREIGEIFTIQDDIAVNVASALQLAPAGGGEAVSATIQPIYPDYSAYELYLQASRMIGQNTKSSLMTALSKLERVLELEPDYADAHAAIARVYLRLASFSGFYEPETAFEASRRLAQPHLERALAIDPGHAEAWVSKSSLWVADHPARLQALEQALSLNPNLYEAHLEIGIAKLSYLLPWSEVIAHLDRAVEIEPLSVEAATTLVLFLAWVPHRWQQAEAIIANLERRDPGSIDVLFTKATWLLNPRGRPAAAIPLLEQILVTDPDHAWARSYLTKAWYMLGEFDRARKMPGGIIHWRYVLSPERHQSLQSLKDQQEWSSPLDYGRRIVSSYAFVMMRDWRSAVELLAAEAEDLDRFTSTYVENFTLNESPAMSLAVAYKALGDMHNYRRFAELEKEAVDIRSDHGQLHNFEYSRAMARLHALEGNGYEAMLELQRLITQGPIDPRELLHPAFDELREDLQFVRLAALQRARINREREQLGLPPLSSGFPPDSANSGR
jgi:TolB-like protein/DNA-binding winged helix-turn-helix (wHTH) protein